MRAGTGAVRESDRLDEFVGPGPGCGAEAAVDVQGQQELFLTVREASRFDCWKTKPIWRRRAAVRSLSERAVSSVPAMCTVPEVGC
ncbi:hypothetical protein SHIRM173S_12628 [Streptomyces hirsutus]